MNLSETYALQQYVYICYKPTSGSMQYVESQVVVIQQL